MCADELSNSSLAAALGATPGESLEDAARRLAGERDGARQIARQAVETLRGLLYEDGTTDAVKVADRTLYTLEKWIEKWEASL